MNSEHIQTPDKKDDELYLKVWEVEQAHVRTRWTITTFFLSVSFAILVLSFQTEVPHPRPSIIRCVALVIYWFTFLLYRRFYDFTKYPSGKGIVSVKVLYRNIGSYNVEDDGFLVNGCRKVCKTEEAAIKKILKKRIKELDKEKGIILDLLRM